MKTTRLLAIALLLFTLFTASKKDKKQAAPPGTIRINDTLFADKTEVQNIGWREFLLWINTYPKDSILYEQMLPDTLIWENNLAYRALVPLEQIYFRHPSYNLYPVVGISYEQAIAFCKWRSDRVNELYEKHPDTNPFSGKKYRYRLPTNDEWEMIAAGKRDVTHYPYGYDSSVVLRKEKWERLFNYSYPTVDSTRKISYNPFDSPEIASPAYSFRPNGYGLYNTTGNVSEMTDTKGIAKGGNYTLTAEECTIKGEQRYSKPTNWLGFRCICVVETKN